MADTTTAQAARPAEHPLIESHRVEGTRVYDRDGKHVGTIDHLVIEKVSGRVVYAVASFGGFLGLGEHLHTIPWEKLHYDPKLYAYRTEVTEAELQDAPSLPHMRIASARTCCAPTGRWALTGCKRAGPATSWRGDPTSLTSVRSVGLHAETASRAGSRALAARLSRSAPPRK